MMPDRVGHNYKYVNKKRLDEGTGKRRGEILEKTFPFMLKKGNKSAF